MEIFNRTGSELVLADGDEGIVVPADGSVTLDDSLYVGQLAAAVDDAWAAGQIGVYDKPRTFATPLGGNASVIAADQAAFLASSLLLGTGFGDSSMTGILEGDETLSLQQGDDNTLDLRIQKGAVIVSHPDRFRAVIGVLPDLTDLTLTPGHDTFNRTDTIAAVIDMATGETTIRVFEGVPSEDANPSWPDWVGNLGEVNPITGIASALLYFVGVTAGAHIWDDVEVLDKRGAPISLGSTGGGGLPDGWSADFPYNGDFLYGPWPTQGGQRTMIVGPASDSEGLQVYMFCIAGTEVSMYGGPGQAFLTMTVDTGGYARLDARTGVTSNPGDEGSDAFTAFGGNGAIAALNAGNMRIRAVADPTDDLDAINRRWATDRTGYGPLAFFATDQDEPVTDGRYTQLGLFGDLAYSNSNNFSADLGEGTLTALRDLGEVIVRIGWTFTTTDDQEISVVLLVNDDEEAAQSSSGQVYEVTTGTLEWEFDPVTINDGDVITLRTSWSGSGDAPTLDAGTWTSVSTITLDPNALYFYNWLAASAYLETDGDAAAVLRGNGAFSRYDEWLIGEYHPATLEFSDGGPTITFTDNSNYPGASANEITVLVHTSTPNNPDIIVTVDADALQIDITLATDADGNSLSTANEVYDALADAFAGDLVGFSITAGNPDDIFCPGLVNSNAGDVLSGGTDSIGWRFDPENGNLYLVVNGDDTGALKYDSSRRTLAFCTNRGRISFFNNVLKDLSDPDEDQDAATKAYVDSRPGAAIVRGPFVFQFNTPGLVPPVYSITGVDQGTGTFTISGDHVAAFSNSDRIRIVGSTGNDEIYYVNSATLNAGNTDIVIAFGPIPDATVDGRIVNLETAGVPFYTPAIDDVLLDVWISLDNPGTFNGTTPKGDMGAALWQPNDANPSLVGKGVLAHAGLGALDMTNPGTNVYHNGTFVGPNPALAKFGSSGDSRGAPSQFVSEGTWKIWMTRDGTIGGLDPGCTTGQARIYIVTARPAPLEP